MEAIIAWFQSFDITVQIVMGLIGLIVLFTFVIDREGT
jgi:hypothetical protein